MTTAMSRHGITVGLDSGWECRIYTRAQPPQFEASGRQGPAGEVTRPIVHLGNFALPSERGDFGSGAVGLMRSNHIFVALLEHGPESLGTALFAHRGLPMPQARDFHPNTLQRRLPGQLGYQRFFTHAERAFCLYVVLGGQQHAVPLAARARDALRLVEIA